MFLKVSHEMPFHRKWCESSRWKKAWPNYSWNIHWKKNIDLGTFLSPSMVNFLRLTCTKVWNSKVKRGYAWVICSENKSLLQIGKWTQLSYAKKKRKKGKKEKKNFHFDIFIRNPMRQVEGSNHIYERRIHIRHISFPLS